MPAYNADFQIADLIKDNERLRAENIKVSCHCAELIEELRGNFGVSTERLKQIAEKVRRNEQLNENAKSA